MSSKKIRVAVELSLPVYERLLRIQERTGAASANAVIGRSVEIQDQTLAPEGDRSVIYRQDPDGSQQQIMLF